MSEFLYEQFLEDPRVYHVARAFWYKQIKQVKQSSPDSEPLGSYLTDRFENGKLFYDGNPMINVINFRTKKAARVVQESPANFEKFYSSWEQAIFLQVESIGQVRVHEKVIVLTLTRNSLERSKSELREWLKG